MKELMFVHDGPRWKNNGVYYGKPEDGKLVQRYEYLADHVSFMMRAKPIKDAVNKYDFSANGINFIEVPTFNRPSNFYKYFSARKIIKKAVKSFDVLIIRLPSTIGGIVLQYANKYHIPYIVEVVGCPYDTLSNYNWLGKIYAPFARRKLRLNVKNAKFVQYVTHEYLQRKYPTNGCSVGVSDVVVEKVNDQLLSNRIVRYSATSQLSNLHMATLGAIDVSYKGQDMVIKALAELKKRGVTKFIYHIVGLGDPTRLKLLARDLGVEEFIVFEGAIPHDKVFQFLDNVDIYIQPSKTEGLPRALVEAMSRGCACIGTNVGGIPELLESKMIYPKNDLDALVNLLLYVDNNNILLENSRACFNKAANYQYQFLEQIKLDFYNKFMSSL
jgi:Glycosyltransferase